jgi:hypothetical protein
MFVMFLSCYQKPCEIEQAITLSAFRPPVSGSFMLPHVVVSFALSSVESGRERRKEMTMMRAGCRRRITFYDEIIEDFGLGGRKVA